MHFTNTLIIDRPVAETFAFISDFENMPKWNYFVEETTSQSPPGRGVGTIYRQRRRTDEQHFVVTDFERFGASAIVGHRPGPSRPRETSG